MHYPKSLARQFRLFMTVGQRFGQQAPLRVQFYKGVLVRAEELYSSNWPMTPSKQKTLPGTFMTKTNATVELATVVRQVLGRIDPRFGLRAQHTPILSLAFDEAHTLAPLNTGRGWSAFTSMRRALRSLRSFPIWTLFLSTTGESDRFSPPPSLDPSSRILQGELASVKPFSALGFDHMVMKFCEGMTLDDVTKLPFRLSLGRPLWLTRYQEGGECVKDTITVFAIQKLLCHAWKNDALTLDEKFAVMSHRLVLDFNTSIYFGRHRTLAVRNQMNQVERHMHVCLGVKDGFESVVTVAASEPILTEATAIILCTIRDKDRSCQMLQDILEWPGMSKGDRGELITCNIIIDTVDDLMSKEGRWEPGGVMVTSLFEALFTHDIYHKSIKDSLPSRLLTGSCNDSFAETFKSSRIYVTHFIKVYDFKVLSVQYLFKLAARGVGVICADNQHGIDVSKNDHSYGTSPKQHLFDVMDPSELGIFAKSTRPPPVIRMVNALASKESKVSVIIPPERVQPSRQEKQVRTSAFTSFDIWCAGASSRTFRTIGSQDDGTYDDLLGLSKDVPAMFEPDEGFMWDAVRSMYPGGACDAGHWSFCGTS
ncbi:uncharacterized protein EI90DRAFT_3064614 [Cantharellus anzutake]|uniref:uncharacterized protein n=1 Tax=Cantharellus anzutake TaxID=1750568 RepID=UPI001904C473|nr:uncharacterized protein EI90DRAFT_3064614 [Cantharellus anzutake]KAF8328569.1 hypothetical protein EI90DRAFT_3064614 [Cantharellus anzutake]